jgi:hypothetical protein
MARPYDFNHGGGQGQRVGSAAHRLPAAPTQAEDKASDGAADREQKPRRSNGQLHLTLDHVLGEKNEDQAGHRPDDRSQNASPDPHRTASPSILVGIVPDVGAGPPEHRYSIRRVTARDRASRLLITTGPRTIELFLRVRHSLARQETEPESRDALAAPTRISPRD